MVFLGSMPFIAFMTWQANTWDLTKRSAFIIAILLCGDVMAFPKAIQSGRVSLWLMSITVLLITGASWPSIMKVRQKKNSQTDNCAETRNKVEIIEQIITFEQEKNSLKPQIMDEVIALGSSEALETIIMSDGNEVLNEVVNEEESPSSVLEGPSDSLSIDDLLELGFNEKNSENFAQAAAYFMRALALKPRPDIAFYLILDCYWLWKNIGESDYALSQIMIYAKKYFSLFSLDLQRQFEAWLNKEDLNKYFK